MKTHALMYHDVVPSDPESSGFSGPGAARYKLRWANFVRHLDRLALATNRPPTTVEDLLIDTGPTVPWLLTFDDGGTSALAIGEELGRRAWLGHFFIVTSLIGTPGFLDTSGIRELRDMGHVVGSHSLTHPSRMSSLRHDELVQEWAASVAHLSNVIGREVRTASVPGGHYVGKVGVAADQAGIEALFTSEPVRRVRRVHTCLVIGRFAIRGNTAAQEAARAAAGHPGTWLREYAGWTLRKPVKAIGGDSYDRVRTRVLAQLEKRRAPEAPSSNPDEQQGP